MKKIFLTVLFAMIGCLNGMAYTWYIIGDEALLGADWDNVAENQMTQFESTARRYLIKRNVEIENANTTYYFRVMRNNTNQFDYEGQIPNTAAGRESRKASVTFARPGMYDLVFCFDEGNATSLDVITCAKVAGGTTPLDWSQNMTQNAMLLEDDHYFHYTATFTATVATTVEYKVIAMHRTTAGDNDASSTTQKHWYGTDGYADGGNVTVYLSEAGTYEVEFLFDPVRKTAPWGEVRQCYDLTIGDAGLASFSCPFEVTVAAGVMAYYFTRVEGTKLPVEITEIIPATTTTPQLGTGVILQADPGTYRFYRTDETVNLTDNILYGTGGNSYLDSGNETYVLAVKDDVVGFYQAGGTTEETQTFAPYKAFLDAADVNAGGNVREFFAIDFDGGTTGVGELARLASADGRCYNLQGQRVGKPAKGIYLLNGRKVLIH